MMNSPVKFIKAEYTYLKLKPNNSLRNNDSHKLARAIASLYKSVFQSVKKEKEKLVTLLGKDIGIGTEFSLKAAEKISYYVYLEKQKAEFYFIVPTMYLPFMKEKISDVWPKITIEQVKELPLFSEKSTRYQLSYEKEDALSLAADLRNNNLLTSNLNILENLEGGDKVGIFYNFIPVDQKSWQYSYKSTLEKVKQGIPVDRNKLGLGYLFKKGISLVDTAVQDVSEVLAGKKEMTAGEQSTLLEMLLEKMNGGKRVSDETTKKISSTILNTQIAVLSESPDKLRQRSNARSLAQSFDTLTKDNRLNYKRLSKHFNFDDYSIGADRNKIGDLEVSNFLSVPGRELLERYTFIDKIETQEIQVPEELRRGTMRIGTSTYRGINHDAFLSTDKEFQYLSLMIIGPNRSGKSTLMGNLVYDALKNNECTIIFDYIGNCELSSEIAALFPPEKVLNIECNDFEKLQGLGYNEVLPSEDVFVQYDNAKKQTTQLMTLINSINNADTPLSAKMERYLMSAALVVFINLGNINDVFEVLQDVEIRHEFLKKVPEKQYGNLKKYMDSLNELDDHDSKGRLIGTKLNLITGIIDRLNKLEANTYMELMLKKNTKNNINLVDEMQKPQLICIKMPEHMFTTDGEKDVYCTYWMTKIWMSLQMRKKKFEGDRDKMKKVNLVIDELYQVKNTESVLAGVFSRLPKFNIKPIISCHYLNQIKTIRPELRSAAASYMLISGCDKENFKELQEELRPFELEDLMSLKRHHSLNLIKTEDGYGKFITKMPPPVSEHQEKQN